MLTLAWNEQGHVHEKPLLINGMKYAMNGHATIVHGHTLHA